MSQKNKLIIVDISNFIFRAFYAIRSLNAPDGTPVNAVYGVLNMLLKLIADYRPTHLFLARDTKKKSFRTEIDPNYKAHRPSPPEELIPQFALIEELISKMKIPSLALPGYEADDIIGSASVQWSKDFDEILVATGDKDIMQFVSDKVKILDTMKEKILGREEVIKKMEVTPEQIVDYLSMVGDSSDNIPGMKGIGAKGASKLLAEFGTLENCFKNKDKIKNKRVKNAFSDDYKNGLKSKELVKIVVDLKLPQTEEDVKYKFEVNNDLLDFLHTLGFKSIIKKLEEVSKTSDAKKDWSSEVNSTSNENKTSKSELGPYKWIKSDDEISQVYEFLIRSKEVACFFQREEQNIFTAKYLVVALHNDQKDSLFISGISEHVMKDVLLKIWTNSSFTVIGHDLKKDIIWAKHNKIEVSAKIFDTNQAHYVIDVASSHNLEFLAQRYLERELPVLSDPIEIAIESVQILMNLKLVFEKKISELELEKIFYQIDTPLIPVLADLELIGVRINPPYFLELEKVFRKETDKIAKELEAIVGDPINLNSPKQVSFLLFEKLGLPIIKRTKTGISTDSEVLDELVARNLSDVPILILRYRELEKLCSTYVSVLPTLVNPTTGRIHTTYNQNVAATGRLSSDNPNLQNIPIKTEDGKKVRKGFIADAGKLLLSADYSQVELRLLAHFANDQVMIKAFNEDKDIHSQTAAEIMGISLAEVTPELRSMAKAVNFGLMYGQSSFGLARNLKIDRNKARDYISLYFARFSSVKAYLDGLKELAEKKGYAETYYGRKRFLPDIRSQNRTIKSVAERVAVNSPIQGTAADIIKLAMINIQIELKNKGFKSKMILQVHDELIFEVEEEELDEMKELVIRHMENVIKLRVPLKVDVGIGVNWLDLN